VPVAHPPIALLLLIAILIKLDSQGPVIFSQERVGSQRQWLGENVPWVIRNFRMLKFRSMYQNADPAVHEAYIRDFVEGRAEESGGKFKLTNDPRVTRVGRILRKFSLDELLQLVNVLKGDMSLVGPRPFRLTSCWLSKRPPQATGSSAGHHGCLAGEGALRVTFEEMFGMDIDTFATRPCGSISNPVSYHPAVISRRGAE